MTLYNKSKWLGGCGLATTELGASLGRAGCELGETIGTDGARERKGLVRVQWAIQASFGGLAEAKITSEG